MKALDVHLSIGLTLELAELFASSHFQHNPDTKTARAVGQWHAMQLRWLPSFTPVTVWPLPSGARVSALGSFSSLPSNPLDFPLPLFLAEGFELWASGASAPGTNVRPLAPPNLLLAFCSELRLKWPPEGAAPADCPSCTWAYIAESSCFKSWTVF